MCSYIVRMWNYFHKISLCIQISYDCFSCFIAVHSCIFATFIIDCSIIIHDIDLWKIMTFSNFKVIRVMCRCDLNRTGSKFFIYIIICNDWNFFVNQWKQYILTNDIFISLVIWMYSNRTISKHCLWTCCSNLKESVCSYDWILNMPEITILLFVFYLCIRQRCLTLRTPVNDTRTFVNISFFIQVDKYFLYSFRTSLVHCKTLSVPVAGNTQFL